MIKQFWGAAGAPLAGGSPAGGFAQGLPSIVTPTLDVKEIDRRIADLRTVEQWLQLNANLLRATIQSLEIQRNTITTLRSFGSAFGNPFDSMAASAANTTRAEPTANPESTAPPPEAAPRRRRAKPRQSSEPADAPRPDALEWWNALQDQFTKVVGSAMTAAAGSAAEAKKKAAR